MGRPGWAAFGRLLATLLMLASAGRAAAQTPECFQLEATRTIPVSELIRDVALADLNGDGKDDLITTGSQLGVRLSAGGGDFGPVVHYVNGGEAWLVETADFNADGKVDVVAMNPSSDTFSILLGDGEGGLGAPSHSAAGGDPRFMSVADMNDDGKADLLILTYGPYFQPEGEFVGVFLGKGDGTFDPPTVHLGGRYAAAIATGDFNGDGRRDFATSNYFGRDAGGAISVALAEGDGFAAPVNYAPATDQYDYSGELAAGDFNGDGDLDLALAHFSWEARVSVLFGNGDGTFAGLTQYRSGTGSNSISVADFNGDGKVDLAVANREGGTVSIIAAGEGGALTSSHYVSGPAPVAVDSGDFNGDGIGDLVVSNSANYPDFSSNRRSLAVIAGNGDGTFEAPPATYVFLPADIVEGDFDRDGKNDLAAALVTYGDVVFLKGRGDGTFIEPTVFYDTDPGSYVITSADFNADGYLDLATSNWDVGPEHDSSSVSVLLGKGDGTFMAAVRYTPGDRVGGMEPADFNRDGHADLAVTTGTSISLLLGKGDGSFEPGISHSLGSNVSSLVVDDFDGDDNIDIATTVEDTVVVLAGKGDGTFAESSSVTVGSGPRLAKAGDFNQDGKTDLVVPNYSSSSLSILLGNGDGTFVAAEDRPTPDRPLAVVIGDLTGDGRPDLVTLHQRWEIAVFPGNGAGGFSDGPQYDAPKDTYAAVIADFDGNGRNDLAVATLLAWQVHVLLNRSTCPSITSVTPNVGSIAGGQTVTITGAGLESALVYFGSTQATVTSSSPTSIVVVTPAHAARTVDVVVTTADAQAASRQAYTFIDETIPRSLNALATTSTRVELSWIGTSNASSYQIDRKQAGEGFVLLATTNGTTYADTAVSPDNSYLYRVRSVTIAGVSGNSTPDLATTVVFADDPLPVHGVVRALHFTEAGAAVNAVRRLAGLGSVGGEQPVPGIVIRATHVSALRSGINEALAALGLPLTPFTSPTLTGVVVRRLQIQELRARVR